MANIFEFLSKDGNITPEKARKSRQMQFHDKTAYVWMGILPLKKRVNRDKCSFATKQRMFGVFAIDEILRYRGTRFPGSRTLCHPVLILSLFQMSWLSKSSLSGNQNLQVAAAHIVRDFHPSEFLGMLGLCGAIITFVQVRLSLALFFKGDI